VYTCNAEFKSVRMPSRSLVVFNFVREKPSSPPRALEGNVTDIHDAAVTQLREVKVTTKLLDFPEARKKAQEEHSKR
jgi:hypothetical protein